MNRYNTRIDISARCRASLSIPPNSSRNAKLQSSSLSHRWSCTQPSLICRSSPHRPSKGIDGSKSADSSAAAASGASDDVSQPLLQALEKLGQMAIDDDDHDADDGRDEFGGEEAERMEEDKYVSQLLAAAGYDDQGMPLEDDDDDVAGSPSATSLSDRDRQYQSRRSKNRGATGNNTKIPPSARIPDELLPRVAIVGRPNVGKSALFNRIVGKQVAIVYDFPGVTRDRLYTRASWGGNDFMLVDTGGLMSQATELPQDQKRKNKGTTAPGKETLTRKALLEAAEEGLPGAIERQAAAAVEESDVVVLVVDGQQGMNASDEEILSWLRKSNPGKPIVLAVNKCENVRKADEQAAEFWSTGFEPIPVSAISGSGTGELLDAVAAALPSMTAAMDSSLLSDTASEDFSTISIAIVGRPNVGKSSLLNSLVGEERSIVSPIAGTTRDAVDTDIVTPDGRSFTLIDTAGVRRRASIASTKDGTEPLSVERAFRAVRRAEVAVLVIDATEGITQQDFRLAEYIAAEGRACVVAVNKWDAIPMKENNTLSDFEANVRAQLRCIEWANVVFTSAKTGQRVKRILDAAAASSEEHRRRISTATLNLVIQDATGWRSPPSTGTGKRGKVYYGTQAGVKPPSFVLFCNDPKLFGDDYRKYMERQFRENIGFPGTPLRLYWRGKAGGGD